MGVPRDDQDSYDAITIRKDPHERVSYMDIQKRILWKKYFNPTQIRTMLQNEPTYMRSTIYKGSAILIIEPYWLQCTNISIALTH